MIKLFLFAALVTGATAEERKYRMIVHEGGWHGVASVRIYPDFIHKCSAVQISNEFFITTARCVSGFEKDVGTMNLLVNSSHVHPEKNSKFLEVKQVYINPLYKRQPDEYNFALLQVPKYDMKMENPDSVTTASLDVKDSILFWRYNDQSKDYSLTKVPARVFPRETCSYILQKDVGPTFFCVEVERPMKSGPFDEGTPSISPLGMVDGLYAEHKQIPDSIILLYLDIYSVRHWIEDVLLQFQEVYESRIAPIAAISVGAALGGCSRV